MNQSLTPADLSKHSLTNQERHLHTSLSEKNLGLAQMYIGAVIALNDDNNPDRFSLAAHGLRELMEKIPEYLNLKIAESNLKSKVIELGDEWLKFKNHGKAKNGATKNEKLLTAFLGKIDEFFRWVEAARPKRRTQIAKVLKTFEPDGHHLPTRLEELRIDEWGEIWNCFINVAHHRVSISYDDFNVWKNALERFLLDRLCPRTFADQQDILAIIQEGDGNAKP